METNCSKKHTQSGLTNGVTLDGHIQLEAIDPQKELQENAQHHDHVQSCGEIEFGEVAVDAVVQVHGGVLHNWEGFHKKRTSKLQQH